MSTSNEVGSLVNTFDLKIGKFYKFKDETTGKERNFIGYVCLKNPLGHYHVAVIQSDERSLIKDIDTLIYLEPNSYVGAVYELENTVLKYDVVVRNSCMTAVGIRD